MATVQFGQETSTRGEFVRQKNRFTARITADGSSGWQAAPGRYRLVVSLACPWAHRALIVRGLLGLEDAISLAVVDPVRDERGWRFTLDEGGRDPVLGIEFLSEAYRRTDPSFEGRVTVPSIVDVESGTVVTNDYPQITLDFSTQWREFHKPGAPDLYPEHLRAEMPVLWAYARDLYQTPGFGETVDFDHIKRHYYYTHDAINPTRIVPKGPVTDWTEPHGRG
jgi:putative glutathione S-transferase